MPTTTLEIDGSPVVMTAANLWPARMTLRLRGLSTLTLVRHGGPLETSDPYVGKSVVLKVDGAPVFSGDVGDRPVDFGELGWSRVYQCMDLTSRADKVPFTDSNTKMDFATWNVDPENLFYLPARAGRTVGQILTDVLTMQENAVALDAAGIGGYTSLSPPTLPAATVADLAAMTVVPPERVRVGGEKLWTAIVSFVQAWAPNHAPRVQADGIVRFLDQRDVTEIVLDFDDCDGRVMPSGLSRSVAECYQRVIVRGQSVAVPRLFSTAQGGLLEDFAYGALSNSAAKAAWTPADFLQDQLARSQGTLSVTDTTHVVLTSTPGTDTWAANDWGPTNRRGVLYVWYSAGSGINQGFSSPVVSNTSKSSGGTSTFTLERALPSTSFDKYILYGISSGASLVWRKYKVADATARAALGRRFSYPAPYIGASGAAVSQTSYPVGSVCWSTSGSPPYNETPDPIVTVNPVDGTILFYAPTYNLAGGVPNDVRALLPVYETPLTATKPTSGFSGTSHAVEGLENTLVVTADSWRDPANTVNIEAYAQDLLDSVKDAIVEGSVVVQRMFTEAFDFGVGVSITASYPTGWEDVNAPVVDVDVTWNSRGPSHYTTRLGVSNRRASYSLSAYMQPERRADDGTMGFASDFGFDAYGGGFQQAGGDYSSATMDSPGQDSSGFDSGGFDMGPIPTSAKDPTSARDPRSARDHTSPRDPTPALDPRSAKDDRPATERPYDPNRKYDTARKFNAPKRTPVDADAMVEARHPADAAAVKETGMLKAETQANQAEQVREMGRAKTQAEMFTGDGPSTQAQAARESQAASERAAIERRNAQKKAQDDADGGQDWRDAP